MGIRRRLIIMVVAAAAGIGAVRAQQSCPDPIPYDVCSGCIDSELVEVAVLAGQVVDPNGESIPGEAVCVGLYSDDGRTYLGSTDVDHNGRFQFHNLKAGTYRVVALVGGLWSPRLRVRVNGESKRSESYVVVEMILPGIYD